MYELSVSDFPVQVSDFPIHQSGVQLFVYSRTCCCPVKILAIRVHPKGVRGVQGNGGRLAQVMYIAYGDIIGQSLTLSYNRNGKPVLDMPDTVYLGTHH